MDYSCDVCDETIKIRSKIELLQSLTHNEFEKRIRMKHTIKNPVFCFLRYRRNFNNYIINHNKIVIYISLNMILN